MRKNGISNVLAVAVALALSACAPVTRDNAPAPAVVAPAQPVLDTGTLEGAPYRIDIPSNWNGELVVNTHGYEPVGVPRQDPWPFPEVMQPLLERGFAIAASAYSAQGWAVGEAVADTERLRRHFVERHGKPRRAWLVGYSMGGLVALASAERHPRAWDGVVSMCGVNVSSETMVAYGALGPLAAFDALFPGVLPQAPGGLADPALPPHADAEAIAAALAKDEARAAALAGRFDLPRSSLAGTLNVYYLVLRELATRAGGFPASSPAGAEGVDGDEAALGVSIRRYAADPDALAYVRESGALTGEAPVPVVLQPNPADPSVPAWFSGGYAALAEAAGRGDRVTQLPPAGENHCHFAPETLPAALESLRGRTGR